MGLRVFGSGLGGRVVWCSGCDLVGWILLVLELHVQGVGFCCFYVVVVISSRVLVFGRPRY